MHKLHFKQHFLLEGDPNMNSNEIQNGTGCEQMNEENGQESNNEVDQEDVEIRQDDDEDAINDSTNDALNDDEEKKSTSNNGFKILEIGEVDVVSQLHFH